MDIEKILADWNTHRTFEEKPFQEDMKYCTVTIDEPEKKGLEELLGNIRHRINNKVKSIRREIERGR